MVIWGIVWGLILGLLWPGRFDGEQIVFGVALGAIAGWSLRRAVRSEVARQRAAAAPVPAPPTEEPATAVPPSPLVGEGRGEGDRPPSDPSPEAIAPADPLPPEIPSAAPPRTADPDPEPFGPTPPALLPALLLRARDWLLGGNTIVRSGVLVLFVGLAFLARYAIDHALLPPELRLAGIALAGAALFATGFRLRKREGTRLAYALTLQGAGVAALYLTIFAAFRLYAFLPSGAAFVMLGLVCAFAAAIALLQNAQSMAFIGFAGGFAAPLLVATGQDNHVGLFSYYLLLNAVIAVIAWMRPWRALHLLGFVSTFGIAIAWGALRYASDKLASTQPFLMAFFLIYLAITLIHALRHRLAARRAVDATLVFGLPLLAFGLQVGLVREIEFASAFSALLLGLVYAVLACALFRRRADLAPEAALASRWLAECFAALALGFVTLAVPLALDARWTSATWAVEGAGVYWMGRRQQRWLGRAAGLLLQLLGALAYVDGLGHGPDARWPLANPAFIGAVLLAASAFAIAWWSREAVPLADAQPSMPARAFARFEAVLPALAFTAAFWWWQVAWGHEILREPLDADGVAQPVFGGAWRIHLFVLLWLLSAFAAHPLALGQRVRPWPVAAVPAWFNLPLMLLAALAAMDERGPLLQAGGWWVWPLALFLHLRMLRSLDAGAPRAWWPWVHGGGVWLLVLLLGQALADAVDRAGLWHTAWAAVILLVAGTGVLLLLSRRAWHAADGTAPARWPLDRFSAAYLWHTAAPLAVLVGGASLAVALLSDGNARPLPYVPLLNPTDLAVALGLAACALWTLRLRGGPLALPTWMRQGRVPAAALAVAGFIALNSVWVRVAHHYAGVAWDAGALFDSFLVQAGYSILWTLLAIACMVLAHRRAQRSAWMVGAGLLALTVVKLFVIDLSNRGGGERIVVFIAVGLLMLVVGYFAPMPPPRERKPPLPSSELSS